MTITTRATLHCDVGLKCTKQIVKTIEGASAGSRVREWARANGWGSWGDRDACPDCWPELHKSALEVEPDAERNRNLWPPGPVAS